MAFFKSFFNQIGRDTGRLVSNKIFGDKHAIRHQHVGSEKSGANSDDADSNDEIEATL